MLSDKLEEEMSLEELITYCSVDLLGRFSGNLSQAAIERLESGIRKQVKQYMKHEFLMEEA